MGNLEFVEGVLEVRDLWRFREEEAEDGGACASGDGFAPAVFGAADGSGCGR